MKNFLKKIKKRANIAQGFFDGIQKWKTVTIVVVMCAAITLCATGCKKPNKPVISGTEPTGTVATQPGGEEVTTPDNTITTEPNSTQGTEPADGDEPTTGYTESIPTEPAPTEPAPTEPSTPPAPEATAEQMNNVVAVKSASAGGTITAHPGGRIIYTISITNNNSAAISVNVTDTLPEGTVLVSGCNNVSGKNLSWNVNRIDAGQTYEIQYTVKPNYTVEQVRASNTDIILTNTGAKVMDKTIAAPSKDIWVLPTFNDTDCYRMKMAIDALTYANLTAKNSSNNSFSGLTLLATVYNVGFTASSGFGTDDPNVVLTNAFEKGTYKSVVPTLYGGTKVPTSADSNFRGNRATSVTTDDLICGDVIIVSKDGTTRNYMYDGSYLVEATTTAVITNIDPTPVLLELPSSDKYLVCRPSFNLPASFSLGNDEYFNDYDKGEYTELENAIIKTAESYLLRGDRAQYTDDYSGVNTSRYETATRQPEDYTFDQYGYTNCASFTYDVHWATYGYKARATQESGSSQYLHATDFIASSAKYGWNATTMTGGNKSTIYYLEPTSSLSDGEKKTIQKTVYELLRPGDVICIKRTTGYGHAMLYVGNGLIIHSTGSSYSSSNKTDTHEATIRYMSVSDLFDSTLSNYVFGLRNFSIIRPQNLTTPKITENTKNRVANMQGVVAEKVSSTAMGKTVNPGDEITYTFYIFNTNNEAKNFAIKDVLSEHVSFVSATNGGSCSGSEVSWNISVPANTRISVSYTVKVKDGVAAYTAIDGSKATINGVVHKCQNTYVANTLTAAQQQQIVAAVERVKNMDVSSLTSVQIANLIYKEAFGVDNIFGEGVTTYTKLLHGDSSNSVRNDNVGIFNDSRYYSSTVAYCMADSNTSKGAMMVAPGMYGGQNVITTYNYSSELYERYTNMGNNTLRSVYFWEKDLVVGDLFLMSTESSQQSLYIYIGNDTFVSLGQGHTLFSELSVSARFQYAPATSWKYLAVLRPSMVWENI